jgi:hypothetical protein
VVLGGALAPAAYRYAVEGVVRFADPVNHRVMRTHGVSRLLNPYATVGPTVGPDAEPNLCSSDSRQTQLPGTRLSQQGAEP